MDHQYPPFVLNQSRYDQNTFTGRLRHFIDVVDPSTLFTSEVKLQQSIQLLDDFRQGKIDPSVTNKEVIWLSMFGLV
jgi:hypothetical protein